MNNSDKYRLKGKLGRKYILDNFERSIMAEKYVKVFNKLKS